MYKTGTKVIMKNNKGEGIIKDAWNPSIANPKVFPESTPNGYCIVLDNNGINVICDESDFTVAI